MKIKLIRDDLGVPPEIIPVNAERVVYKSGQPFWAVGSVIDEPNARAVLLLVRNGDAEPADEEAESVCIGWKQNRDEVLLSREMLAKAIEPEDRDRYRRGEILGYDADGNDIPGPNWVSEDDDDDSEDEEDDT